MATTKKAAPRKKTASSQKAVKTVKKAAGTVAQAQSMARLQRWNGWWAAIFGAQALGILLLSTAHPLPLMVHYLAVDPLASDHYLVAASRELVSLNLVQLVAALLLVAAATHAVVATVYRRQYEQELARGLHRFRWLEFGISSSLMLLILGLLVGIYDVASLSMLVALSFLPALFYLFAEFYTKAPSPGDRAMRRIACVVGVAPWLVLLWYVFGTHVFGLTHLASYVYELFGATIVLFGAFGVHFYLERVKRGRWIDVLYGEKVYLLLSLLTKTVFAWLLFEGALRP